MSEVRPIPEGVHTITPHLVLRDAAKAIEFYKRAFGARELHRSAMPDGRVMHAALQVGDSVIYLSDEFPGGTSLSPQALGGTTVALHIYVEDVDALWAKAIGAGASVTMPLADQFWGDRYGKVVDPYGHEWSLATHKENVSAEEMERRTREVMARFAAAAKEQAASG